MADETNWTPGPWWVDEDHDDAVVCERGMVADMEVGCPREEYAANARLIAKAPEMVVLLKRSQRVLRVRRLVDADDLDADIAALLAEIDGAGKGEGP